ncbi:glucosamine-6-phosphate deaminase [Peribacillus frigoritolerans]|uniref:glucosamine-6-phosphate deaminase n=1 Tax=Peribacillus frigoritolerans TaxID=450367 RepID=UPI003D2A3AAC
MRLIVTENYEEMSYFAAQETAKFIKENPELVLGLSTGGTPLGTYQELIKLHENENLDFSKITTFNLDEYIGLEPKHPQSYTRYTWDNFLSKVNIQKQNVHIPPGIFIDEKQVLKEYDEKILELNGIDVQILGVGRNGHIGFNEPNQFLHPNTHIVNLTDETIKDNSRFFLNIDEVPKQAIAMGVGSILRAKHIIFIASGDEKAEPVRKTFNEKITTHCPSSLLQLHANLTVILDKKAARLLN